MEKRITKEEFLARVAAILDGREVATLSNDEVDEIMAVTNYAWDLLLNEAEARGMIEHWRGSPVIPYCPPEGIEIPETLLTRLMEPNVQSAN